MRRAFVAAALAVASGEAWAQGSRLPANPPPPPPRPDISAPATPEVTAEPAKPRPAPPAPPPPPSFWNDEAVPARVTMRCSLEGGGEFNFAFDSQEQAFHLDPGGRYSIVSQEFLEDMLVLRARDNASEVSARIGARSFMTLRSKDGNLRILPCFNVIINGANQARRRQ